MPDIGGKNPFYYFTLFFCGYLLMADPRFTDIIDRQRGRALLLGIVTMTLTITIRALRVDYVQYSLQDVLYYVLRTFNTWYWLVAILGYGRRLLNFTNRLQRYANEAAYPFYILHQTVIIAVGFFVVRWDLNLWLKFFIIMALAFGLTLLLYEFGVRRTNVTRFLFGMKLKPGAKAAVKKDSPPGGG